MSVIVRTLLADAPTTADALADLGRQLDAVGMSPHFALVFYDDVHDDETIDAFLRTRLPGTAIIGGTSNHGMVDQAGIMARNPIGIFAIEDAAGSFGAASAERGTDPAATAETLLREALADADADGELPELVFTYLAPGVEEAALAGFHRVVGDRCPIIGGTSIDNDVIGRWRQFGPGGVTQSGIAVAVLFPSGGVGVSFQGGYEPTGAAGTVTEVEAPDSAGSARTIVSIDDRPALDVYQDWRGEETVPEQSMTEQVLVQQTVRNPLGVQIGSVDGISYYRLVQPGMAEADGRIHTFAGLSPGDEVCLMRGDPDALVRRAGIVISAATTELANTGFQPAGGVIIYCGGCRLAVGDALGDVVHSFQTGFAGAPFLGLFTGGEQGPVLGRAIHGNLMISAIVFGS